MESFWQYLSSIEDNRRERKFSRYKILMIGKAIRFTLLDGGKFNNWDIMEFLISLLLLILAIKLLRFRRRSFALLARLEQQSWLYQITNS